MPCGDHDRRLAVLAVLSGLVVAAAVAPAYAEDEPVRVARPFALTGGVAVLGGPGDAVPYLTAQAAYSALPWLAITGDLAFFTSGDRVFGPRLIARTGARAYLLDGRSGPFVGAFATVLHLFEVTISYSDSSQQAGTSLGGGGVLGHELLIGGSWIWDIELGVGAMDAQTRNTPDGWFWDARTTFGARW